MHDGLRSCLDAMRRELQEHHFQNTNGFLVGDAVIGGRRWLDIQEQAARLERHRRGETR